MNRWRSLAMIKRIRHKDLRFLWAILAILFLFGAPRLVGAFQSSADIQRLYAEIEGDYEFYFGQRYWILRVTSDQGKLWGQNPGESPRGELYPVDPAELKFRIEDPSKAPGQEQYIVFVQNPEGRISGLRLLAGGTETPGMKLPSGGRVSRPVESEIPAAALRSDLLQIRRALEETHPAIYAFTPKDDFERLYEKQLRLIDGPMSLGEFFRIAAPLVVAVGCGHTALASPSDYWRTAPKRFFPLALRLIGGHAFVIRSDDPSSPLPPGSEILSIQGLGIGEVQKELKAVISSDGANDGWKTAQINAAFALFYAFRFGFPEEFIVEALTPGGAKTARARLQAVERSKIPSNRLEGRQSTSSGDPNLDFEILPDGKGTAVLTMGSFAYYQAHDQFKRFIDEAFDRIRQAGVQHLILDLRDNDGGDPFCTACLLGYLERVPVPYFARSYPQYEIYADPIPRAPNAFDGKLYVLVNGGCFSSTGHFCGLLRYHKIGTFIGSETGGTYECNDARQLFELRNTRLRLFVARMTFTAAVKDLPRFRGIIPDVPVELSLADYLSGRDAIRERALSLIANDDSGGAAHPPPA
jgi:hypothetical protein